MTRLTWGEEIKRIYEVGVDRGVLYPNTGPGVAWNGLVSVVDASSDSEESQHYIDGFKYSNRQNSGSFSAKLEAFTYPNEFSVYDGVLNNIIHQQFRKAFGFSYRTRNKIHLVYNALASPTEKNYVSNHETEDPTMFSWEITTIPLPIQTAKPTAHLIVDTIQAHDWTVAALEDILYGNEVLDPSLPDLNSILELFEGDTLLRVIDNLDGTFTVIGSDEAVQMLDATTFQISGTSVVIIDEVSYKISSL